MVELTMNTPSMSGKICIGEDVFEKRLSALIDGKKNFVLTDSNVYRLYREFFDRWFGLAEIFVLSAGEEYKSFQSLQSVLEKMVGAGLKRTAKLFAVGGGVIGDIGGLCASLYMRGIACVQIPTTLLAMVDSSVGGKTAINVCGLKNVIGSFYQPMEVLINPSFLDTLPEREWKCGMGEMIKYAALDKVVFDVLEQAAVDACGMLALSMRTLSVSLIDRCISYKIGVCSRDEKEAGERKCLNVGHTTGHALELAFGLSHGESVLWGMMLETKIAIKLGVCERVYGQRLLRLVEAALAVEPRGTLDVSRLREAVKNARFDKKNTDDDYVVMSVAKAYGEWTLLSVSALEYFALIEEVATL